jgi:hypothetical protein
MTIPGPWLARPPADEVGEDIPFVFTIRLQPNVVGALPLQAASERAPPILRSSLPIGS